MSDQFKALVNTADIKGFESVKLAPAGAQGGELWGELSKIVDRAIDQNLYQTGQNNFKMKGTIGEVFSGKIESDKDLVKLFDSLEKEALRDLVREEQIKKPADELSGADKKKIAATAEEEAKDGLSDKRKGAVNDRVLDLLKKNDAALSIPLNKIFEASEGEKKNGEETVAYLQRMHAILENRDTNKKAADQKEAYENGAKDDKDIKYKNYGELKKAVGELIDHVKKENNVTKAITNTRELMAASGNSPAEVESPESPRQVAGKSGNSSLAL